MKISMIVSRYLDPVTGSCLANARSDVLSLDLDKSEIGLSLQGAFRSVIRSSRPVQKPLGLYMNTVCK